MSINYKTVSAAIEEKLLRIYQYKRHDLSKKIIRNYNSIIQHHTINSRTYNIQLYIFFKCLPSALCCGEVAETHKKVDLKGQYNHVVFVR
jgi:hypothetical protein